MNDDQMLLQCIDNFSFAGLFAILVVVASITYVVMSFRGAIKAYKEEHNIED